MRRRPVALANDAGMLSAGTLGAMLADAPAGNSTAAAEATAQEAVGKGRGRRRARHPHVHLTGRRQWRGIGEARDGGKADAGGQTGRGKQKDSAARSGRAGRVRGCRCCGRAQHTLPRPCRAETRPK